jgi:hypothetical protein
VFKNFEKDGEFFCFVGQSTQAVTGMYNLNKASQIGFQGEDILDRARIFSYEFLRQREAQGMLHDKWIIAKDLAGEVIKSIIYRRSLIKTLIQLKVNWCCMLSSGFIPCLDLSCHGIFNTHRILEQFNYGLY